MPAFRRVFKKYDRLNESIEENVRGMRVVKGFAREEYEKKKANAEKERRLAYRKRMDAYRKKLAEQSGSK